MIVIGIDASTVRCGFAVMDDKADGKGSRLSAAEAKRVMLRKQFSMSFKPSDPHRMRRRAVAETVLELVETWNPEFVLLERIRLFHQGKVSLDTIVRLAAMWGAITDATTADVFSVNTSTWKKHILGSGLAQKEDAVRYVLENYDMTVTHDLADAICIAEFGVRGDRSKLTEEK